MHRLVKQRFTGKPHDAQNQCQVTPVMKQFPRITNNARNASNSSDIRVNKKTRFRKFFLFDKNALKIQAFVFYTITIHLYALFTVTYSLTGIIYKFTFTYTCKLPPKENNASKKKILKTEQTT